MSDQHPDFSGAPEGQRWAGSLDVLFFTLTKEAYEAHGRWVTRVLPRGAWVAMRVPVDTFPRKELRIARRKAPEPRYEQAWETEKATFLAHAKCHPSGGWLPTKEDRAGGAIKQHYVELFPLEVAPDKVKCAEPGCEAVVAFALSERPLRCEACQRKADVREVQANINRRVDGAA